MLEIFLYFFKCLIFFTQTSSVIDKAEDHRDEQELCSAAAAAVVLLAV